MTLHIIRGGYLTDTVIGNSDVIYMTQMEIIE